jgi:hypothetical protein
MTLLNGNQTMVLMTAFTRTMEKSRKNKWKTICRFYCIYSYDDGTATNYNVECKVGLDLNGLQNDQRLS